MSASVILFDYGPGTVIKYRMFPVPLRSVIKITVPVSLRLKVTVLTVPGSATPEKTDRSSGFLCLINGRAKMAASCTLVSSQQPSIRL